MSDAKQPGAPARAGLPGFPATPQEAAEALLELLLAVANAQHAQTTIYCSAFLGAEGPQETRRAIAAQQSAAAQRDLDMAAAVLEAWRLQADMEREVTR